MNFFKELSNRNRVLYFFGWFNFIAALICIVLIQFTDIQVLGINAFIKPMKFFFSIGIFCWTMGWYMYYLQSQKKVSVYNRVVIIVMLFEMSVIVWQAANGRLSHFNTSTKLYAVLFNLMGVAIVTLVFWTLSICILFFRQKQFNISFAYLWGIRLGIILFIIFSFEGGVMAAILSHTIGAPDGGEGLPVINWSTHYGDLRVAHFFGMHALQILPLVGFYITKTKSQIIIVALVYFVIVSALLVQALNKMPLLG